MYTKNHKNEFLNQFENEYTRKVYESTFRKVEVMEQEVQKDVMDFSKEMFEKLITTYVKPSTKQSARTYCHILSSYIQWSIDKEYSANKLNPLQDGNSSYFEEFVKNQNSLYMSKNEIDMIIFSLVNAQDSFIVKALFEGIQGRKLYELVNLTKYDIENARKNDNLLKLPNEKGDIRAITVEDETLKLAEIAIREQEYYKKNGEADYHENIKETAPLVESDYVLRPVLTNNDKIMLTHYSVYNRLEMIKGLEEFDEYKESLTTKNIVRSGMIYEAKKVLDSGLPLNRNTIELICLKYGIKYKWSLKDFLNEDTVREVYALWYTSLKGVIPYTSTMCEELCFLMSIVIKGGDFVKTKFEHSNYISTKL